MFSFGGRRFRYNRHTGEVVARNAKSRRVTLEPYEERAARCAFDRYSEAFGYACAMQDAASDYRDTDAVTAFAGAFAVNVYTREIGVGRRTANVADAWATWQTHGRLDVPAKLECRYRRPQSAN